jgi:hypothetical protein
MSTGSTHILTLPISRDRKHPPQPALFRSVYTSGRIQHDV